jgi:response regulator RpfG family c-di-GMP phosphodiesterase
MEILSRYDMFEPGDKTALVCIDYHEVQKIVIDQLNALEYRIHTGLFTEDITLKLKTHVYDLVVIDENFNEADIETNQILNECKRIAPRQRRRQFITVVGPNMITNNAMQAFQFSVDLVCSLNDLPNLGTVLRRGVIQHRDFYQPFLQTLEVGGS